MHVDATSATQNSFRHHHSQAPKAFVSHLKHRGVAACAGRMLRHIRRDVVDVSVEADPGVGQPVVTPKLLLGDHHLSSYLGEVALSTLLGQDPLTDQSAVYAVGLGLSSFCMTWKKNHNAPTSGFQVIFLTSM